MDYQLERKRLLRWIKKKLIGEDLVEGKLEESNPFNRYVTGVLYPLSKYENSYEEKGAEEDDDEASAIQKTSHYQPPSSMGFSFYMAPGDHSLRVFFDASHYLYLNKNDNIHSWKKKTFSDSGDELIFNSRNGLAQNRNVFDGRARVDVLFRAYDTGSIVTITLTNIQKEDSSDCSNKRDKQAEGALFEVELKCLIDDTLVYDYPSINKELLSKEEREIELRYKDDRVYAIGHGVAVDWYVNKKEGLLEIFSEFMPTVEVPQVTADTSDKSANALSFKFLSQIETNSAVIPEISEYILEYKDWISLQQSYATEEDGDDLEAAARIVEKMQIAKERMQGGISFLKQDPIARKAFAIANKAMLAQMQGRLVGGDEKYKWRPFQLAFILMVLESAIEDEDSFRDTVDLIWFPTGGGKTEAYLGLMAFLFIYRRMKFPASSSGTITIMRYTLRLLTSQQFIRACKVISALELIRQKDDSLGNEPFTIGLWLGSATSPNTFYQAREKVANQQYSKLVLTACPWCKHPFTHDSYVCSDHSFHFTCLNLQCDFGKKPDNVLPYNVVDEALYQSPPSLLIATVDKFSRLAWEDKATSFFGSKGNRPPELIIQDELHLISGALGSIVGLYEAGFETILLAKGINAKYIASTATIKNADAQVKSLFGREVAVFPPSGLRHTDSYFAKIVPLNEKPGRLYIGYMAYGLAKNSAIEPLAGALLAAPDKLFSHDELLMDAWWTQVIYHGSLKGVGNSRTNYQSGVVRALNKLNDLNFLADIEQESPGKAKDLKRHRENKITGKYPKEIEGNEPLEKIYDQYYPTRELYIKSLTSNQSAQENADIFENLANSRDQNVDKPAIDVALSTNMISVGLDVSRLALMIVNGQPMTTAEYIQASSRVGRGDVPGLVFINYYKTQARSLSHYENFKSYHQSFYRYVEPSSLTPFTYQVRKRALHAALVIAIRHSGVGLLKNNGAEEFDANNPAVRSVITKLKLRIKQATPSSDIAENCAKHIDQLVDEWTIEVERCQQERVNLRYAPVDKCADALLVSYENKNNQTGLWETLNSMRNVEKTGLFKILKGVKNGKF